MASSKRPSSSSPPEPPTRSRRRPGRMRPPPSTSGRGSCSSCYSTSTSSSKRALMTLAAPWPPPALRGGHLRSGRPQRIGRQVEQRCTKSCFAAGWRTFSLSRADWLRRSRCTCSLWGVPRRPCPPPSSRRLRRCGRLCHPPRLPSRPGASACGPLATAHPLLWAHRSPPCCGLWTTRCAARTTRRYRGPTAPTRRCSCPARCCCCTVGATSCAACASMRSTRGSSPCRLDAACSRWSWPRRPETRSCRARWARTR
mmetsp:Transcript_47839/g.114898  ORF Transcript_47839/g.114898 Transcript_47839/m.114898 type:complete len:256 (+) Transcript_47839:246-1013(+)